MIRPNAWLLSIIALVVFQCAYAQCPQYDEKVRVLEHHYGEQLIFRGFSRKSQHLILELWAAEKSWTLLQHAITTDGDTGRSLTCVQMVNSGGYWYEFIGPWPSSLTTTSPIHGCIPFSKMALGLEEHYLDRPRILLSTKTNTALYVLFVKHDSWTLSQARVASKNVGGQNVLMRCVNPNAGFAGDDWDLRMLQGSMA